MTTHKTPAQERLGMGLRRLKELQNRGLRVYRSVEFQPTHRVALERAGFLGRITRGWYLATTPGEPVEHPTTWPAVFRDFLARYCDHRFHQAWHLSPAQSLQMHAGATSLPPQVVVYTSTATNYVVSLPGGASLVLYRTPEGIDPGAVTRLGGVQVLTLEHSLVRAPEACFSRITTDLQVALRQLESSETLSRLLITGGHPTIAGRLVGALRANHQESLADAVLAAVRGAGYDVRESVPFAAPLPELRGHMVASPAVRRLEAMWSDMRTTVLEHFPSAPGLSGDGAAAVRAIATRYSVDAWHSLSIEGYRVTARLLERVTSREWSPEPHTPDAQDGDVLAARGYFLAHTAVTDSIATILAGAPPAAVVEAALPAWYHALFSPGLHAGLLEAGDLAGYRRGPVYLRNAWHVPPPGAAVPALMTALSERLADETEPSVRAILGHFFLGYVHPYPDGNGRMARFLMNAMLASGGYPWVVVPVERRAAYLAALELGSVRGAIRPFVDFVASCMRAESP